MNVMKRFRDLLIALPMVLAMAGLCPAAVVTVDLVAEQVDVTMPDGKSVPMWKLRRSADLPGSPPPVISAVAGDSLVITLTNNLAGATAEPVSLVINGQTPDSMTPTWTNNDTGDRTDVAMRVRSFTHETDPNGGEGIYTWPQLKAGTFLLTSGTHPGVQVPMGLYAAVKVDQVAAAPPELPQAYGPDSAYAGEVVLLFSEVDPALNTAVATGTYGTPAYPTALSMRYEPAYFLVNGAPFSAASAPLPVAGVGQPSLLRFLNAGLRGRIPVTLGEYMTVIADDGNMLSQPIQTYSLDLAAGKRFDVLIQPLATGLLTVHDRAGGMAGGGMVAQLLVTDGAVPDYTNFVGKLYRDFFGRIGSDVEIQGWVAQLDAGTITPAEAVDAFMNSAEYLVRVPPIVRLYMATFLRIPDYDGLLSWVDQHALGMPLAEIADVFATSPEFLATYGALNNAEFITLLYQNVLGRLPDAEGLAFWVGELDSGARTRGDVLAGFSESPEYVALTANEVYVVGVYAGLLLRAPSQGEYDTSVAFLNGGGSVLAFIENLMATVEYLQIGATPLVDNPAFVGMLYPDFLGRAGTPVEIQGWLDQLDAGTATHAEVVDGIMTLAEYAERFPPVARLYLATFLRIPDHDGLSFWVEQHALGMTVAQIADVFANSQEFLDTYGALNNTEYVTLLYQNILGREPDPDGLAFWVGELDAGTMTRGDVLVGFSEAAEYVALSANQVYVIGAYDGLLGRSPTQGEYDTWVAALDGGGSVLVFLDDLLASYEFLVRLR